MPQPVDTVSGKVGEEDAGLKTDDRIVWEQGQGPSSRSGPCMLQHAAREQQQCNSRPCPLAPPSHITHLRPSSPPT